MRAWLGLLAVLAGCGDSGGDTGGTVNGPSMGGFGEGDGFGAAPQSEAPCAMSLDCLDCSGYHVLGTCVNGVYTCPTLRCGPAQGTGGAASAFGTTTGVSVSSGVGGGF